MAFQNNTCEYETDAVAVLPPQEIEILKEPVDIEVELGKLMTMHCNAISVKPAFQWFDQHGNKVPGETSSTLKLGPIKEEHYGFYRLQVFDSILKQDKLSKWVEVKKSSHVASLPISTPHPAYPRYPNTQPLSHLKPLVTVPPRGGSFKRGETITLSATCQNVSCFQWMKDGDMLVGCTGTALTISRLQPSNTGMYSLIVSNSTGIHVTSPVQIQVREY